MDPERVKDEFERIETIAKLEKEREIIAQYVTGLDHARGRVERPGIGWGVLTKGWRAVNEPRRAHQGAPSAHT
jgi:hypothetical protein